MDSKTVESKVEPVSSQFGLGYITSYKSNLESLKTEVQKLEATKNSVRDSVDEATKNGEVIVNVVITKRNPHFCQIKFPTNIIQNNKNILLLSYPLTQLLHSPFFCLFIQFQTQGISNLALNVFNI